MSTKKINDSMFFKDTCGHSHPQTLWAKTQVIGGYGLHKNSFGVSSLDEVVFETENMVPIGGVQYAMEQLFGVKGPLHIPSLNTTMKIGAQESALEPSEGMPYPYGQKVCLFGVGTEGAASNNITALDVKYNEYTIKGMVPLRYTNLSLGVDEGKYVGKKDVDGTTAYYLKKFDTDPIIQHLYKTGLEDEDGPIVEDDIFSNDNLQQGVESFTEMTLLITKKDVREWFKAHSQIEQCRINSIGLFTAVYDKQKKDYANIQLFSKLNIPTEPLSLAKDMNILYRVYGA